MEVRHVMGGDMTLVLDPSDIDKIERGGFCQNQVECDGVILHTRVQKDEFTTEPIAQTDGHSVDVYLPLARTILPTDVKVCQMTPTARFYFGEAGKICLVGQVEV